MVAPAIWVQLPPELSQSNHWLLVVVGVPIQIAGTSVSVSPGGGEVVVESAAGEMPGGVPVSAASAPAASRAEPTMTNRPARPKMVKCLAIARNNPP